MKENELFSAGRSNVVGMTYPHLQPLLKERFRTAPCLKTPQQVSVDLYLIPMIIIGIIYLFFRNNTNIYSEINFSSFFLALL